MQADDRLAEWLVRWEEARAANRPPPALDQLPAELRPRAREGLRLLRGFARMAHGLTTTGPPRPAPPRRRRRTRRATASRRSWPGAAWPRCGAASTRCWRAGWP
jgi:hypothetical protein